MTESLSVVVPAYKEEVNIERVYERLSAVLDGLGLDWELIFSVDPSPDRTPALAEALERAGKPAVADFVGATPSMPSDGRGPVKHCPSGSSPGSATRSSTGSPRSTSLPTPATSA